MATTTGQPANVGGRQGGTETPSLWNYLLEYILEELVAKWNDRGWGFRFDNGPLVNHMIWADNVYLVASSTTELFKMFEELTAAIYNNKLRWKGGELKYMTGTNVEGCGDYHTMMPDGEVLDIAYTEELEVLGVMLDRRGATDTSIDHRLNKAEGNYGYMAKALKDKMAPPKEKLQAWAKGHVNSAVYGDGGWPLSQHKLHSFRRWENRHLRAFLRIRRKPDEGVMLYNRRTNKIIHRFFVNAQVLPIYVRVLRQQHRWARTWWSFSLDDGSQPLKFYMNCRPAAQWENRRSIMRTVDSRNSSGWRHQHTGCRLNWEDIFNIAQPAWRTILNRSLQEWSSTQDIVVKKMCDHAHLATDGFHFRIMGENGGDGNAGSSNSDSKSVSSGTGPMTPSRRKQKIWRRRSSSIPAAGNKARSMRS